MIIELNRKSRTPIRAWSTKQADTALAYGFVTWGVSLFLAFVAGALVF